MSREKRQLLALINHCLGRVTFPALTHFSFSIHPGNSTIIIPILLLRKLRHRGVKYLIQGHLAGE